MEQPDILEKVPILVAKYAGSPELIDKVHKLPKYMFYYTYLLSLMIQQKS